MHFPKEFPRIKQLRNPNFSFLSIRHSFILRWPQRSRKKDFLRRIPLDVKEKRSLLHSTTRTADAHHHTWGSDSAVAQKALKGTCNILPHWIPSLMSFYRVDKQLWWDAKASTRLLEWSGWRHTILWDALMHLFELKWQIDVPVLLNKSELHPRRLYLFFAPFTRSRMVFKKCLPLG